MTFATGAIADPFALPGYFTSLLFPSASGRVIERPAILTGKVGVFIVAGQSLGSNTIDASHSVINVGKVHNLNILDGGLYAMVDPLLGSDVGAGKLGNLFTRVADGLVSAGVFDHVVIVPASIGGTVIAQWDESFWINIVSAYGRAEALGMSPTAILWQHGESDNALGTSSASYQASFSSMRSKVTQGGVEIPWLLAKSTRFNGTNSAAIRSAIDALTATGGGLFAGPDTDSVTSRQSDGTHLNDAGGDAASALWVSVLDAAY